MNTRSTPPSPPSPRPERPIRQDTADGMTASNTKEKKKGLASLFSRSQDFIKPTDIIRVRGNVDRPMLIIILLLFCFGCIMVFSASYSVALTSKGDSYFYIKRHLIFGIIGIGAMFLAAHFDYRWMRGLVVPFYLATYGLLAAVLLYGVAAGVAQRWIVIGPINLQPSEIMKLALVLLLAAYAARFQEKIIDYAKPKASFLYGNVIPFAIIGLSVLPVMLEKHLSGTIIIAVIGIVVVFASGGRKLGFVVAAVALVLLVVVATRINYIAERLDTFLNLENYWDPVSGEFANEEAKDAVWQTVQGLIAVGSGGIFGVGLGNSTQKHSFLPMPHNDFIFSIICEELGLIGAIAVILLFMLFIWRGFTIARRAPDTFSSLVVIGITTQVGLQAMLNMAVVTGLIPNTGVSLPFFSYGGTSLLMLLGEMGIVLSISRYSYQKQ